MEIGTEAKECFDYHYQKHVAERGIKPTFSAGAGIKLFKILLKECDVLLVKEVTDFFFQTNGRSDFSVRALYNRFDTLHGVLKDKAEGRR